MTNADPRPHAQPPDASPPLRQRSADLLRSDYGAPRLELLFPKMEYGLNLDFRVLSLDFWEHQAYPRLCRGFEVLETGWW